jgi:hypothetical protein
MYMACHKRCAAAPSFAHTHQRSCLLICYSDVVLFVCRLLVTRVYAQILEEMRQWRRVSTTDSESGTSSKGLTAGAPHLKVRATILPTTF